MKTPLIKAIMLMLIASAILYGCKKDETEEPANPDYPQLIGTWTGFNDQGDTVILKVNNVGATLYIYSYKYAVTYQEGGTSSKHSIEITNTQGIAPILNKSFALVPLDPFGSPADTLSGTFDTETLKMTGKTKTTFTDITGSPVIWTDFALVKQ